MIAYMYDEYGKPLPFMPTGHNPTTQQEIITWHKYHNEKPTRPGRYLVCAGEFEGDVVIGYWVTLNGQFQWFADETRADPITVISFANLPKGYRE